MLVAEVFDQTDEQYNILLKVRNIIINRRVFLSKLFLTRLICASLDRQVEASFEMWIPYNVCYVKAQDQASLAVTTGVTLGLCSQMTRTEQQSAH